MSITSVITKTLLLVAVGVPGSMELAGATDFEIHPGESLASAVQRLQPGDTLRIHQGAYIEQQQIRIRVKGTNRLRVTIKGIEGEPRPRIGRSPNTEASSTLIIDGASYLTIKGLEITSNGGDGIRLLNNPSFIWLEDLEIHEVDVGINFRSNMHHIRVTRNHIYQTGAMGGTGEGLYVGCNYADCAVSDSLIQGNWIHDTLQASQGDGIEVKRGSYSNVVRDNVIYNTKYPCILLYGTEGKGRNLVEGNAVWNCGEAGIQAAADAIIRNNIILSGPGIGFYSQEHQEVLPGNLEFVHNTVVGVSPCVKLAEWDKKLGLVFANNAIYCEGTPLKIIGRLQGVSLSGNIVYPLPAMMPVEGFSPGHAPLLDFVDVFDRNVYPAENSALIAAGDTLYVTELDFNGTLRSEVADVGAYAWTGMMNRGWKIGAGFKQSKPLPR